MNLWKSLSEDGQTITIRRFNGDFSIPAFVNAEWIAKNSAEIGRAAVVDVETTGLDYQSSRVIEIAVRTLKFHRTLGCLVSLEDFYDGLQDPGFPLSSETTEITGITDEDVRGKRIDWERVKILLNRCELIIAHNAGFDRPFIERELGEMVARVWACSWRQIDWDRRGYGVKQLGLLCAYHGFFTDAHRALNDVNSLVHLLAFGDGENGQGYLSELHRNANRPQVRVIAAGSPFETKDLLKARGYQWNGEMRAWSKLIYEDETPDEIKWLEGDIYHGRFAGRLVKIPLLEAFRGV